jgi:hypothetical protein
MASALEIIREPATLIKDPSGTPLYFHFKDGLTLKPVQARFDITHNGGLVDRRLEAQTFEISGRLVGEWENLSTLFPLISGARGSRLIGATDTPWVLITESGRKWVWHRSAITKRPGIMAKVGDTLLGDITLTGFYSITEGKTFTYTTGETHPGFASLDNATILTLAPACSFGSDPWDELWPTDGVEIDFGWDLEPVVFNRQILDYSVKLQNFTAKVKPQSDATFAELMTKIHASGAMGSTPPVADLNVSYSGFYARLYNCQAEIEQFQFSHSQNFIDGMTARAMQRYSAGAAVALGYVGTSAPA